jgi:hypothetical protein
MSPYRKIPLYGRCSSAWTRMHASERLNSCFSVLRWTPPILLVSFYFLGSKRQHHSQVFHIGNALFLYASINPSKPVSSSDIMPSRPASNSSISRSFIVKSFFLRQKGPNFICGPPHAARICRLFLCTARSTISAHGSFSLVAALFKSLRSYRTVSRFRCLTLLGPVALRHSVELIPNEP